MSSFSSRNCNSHLLECCIFNNIVELGSHRKLHHATFGNNHLFEYQFFDLQEEVFYSTSYIANSINQMVDENVYFTHAYLYDNDIFFANWQWVSKLICLRMM